MREISKEEFKKSIIENVKNQYRRTIDEATPQQIFQAVSYAIKDVIIDDWIATQKQFDETGAKKVYYLSMEFLMGRALGNNIINLGAKKAVKEALEELGFDLNAIEDQEPFRGVDLRLSVIADLQTQDEGLERRRKKSKRKQSKRKSVEEIKSCCKRGI